MALRALAFTALVALIYTLVDRGSYVRHFRDHIVGGIIFAILFEVLYRLFLKR